MASVVPPCSDSGHIEQVANTGATDRSTCEAAFDVEASIAAILEDYAIFIGSGMSLDRIPRQMAVFIDNTAAL